MTDRDRREKDEAADPAASSGEAAPEQAGDAPGPQHPQDPHNPDQPQDMEASPEPGLEPEPEADEGRAAAGDAEAEAEAEPANPLEEAADQPLAEDEDPVPGRRASERLASSDPDQMRKVGVGLALGLGAALLIPAFWAAGWVVGLEVPGSQRNSAGSMAMLMLSAWPIALLLFVAAGLMVRQIRNRDGR